MKTQPLKRYTRILFIILLLSSSKQGGGLSALNARVYAVKVNFNQGIYIIINDLLQVNQNRLLDVARSTFKENVADIHSLSRELSQQYELPLQLVYQEHGFVFSLRKSDLEEAGITELPKGFINASSRKGKWFFECLDLVHIRSIHPGYVTTKSYLQKKRNARMKDSLDETLMLSDRYSYILFLSKTRH